MVNGRSGFQAFPFRHTFGIRVFAAVVFGLFVCSCTGERQVGDGWLSDKGIGSYYPRRRITLPAIPVGAQAEERVYRLRGVPKDFYTVWLIPVVKRQDSAPSGPGPREYCLRTGLSAEVIVSRLTDPRVARAHGRLVESCDKRDPDSFEEGGYGQEWAIVGGTLQNIMLRRDVEIRVRVWAEQFDPSLPHAEIRILLVGGGFKI